MSMNATFVQVDPAELAQLQANPSLAEALFQDGPLMPPIFAKLNETMQQRIAHHQHTAALATASHTSLSLDKAWHGVHYLLCGEVEPSGALLSQAVLGGTPLGDDDEGFSGYGPARYYDTAQVLALSEALNRPDVDAEAAGRFDSRRMTRLDIYPGWQHSADKAKEDQEWLLENLARLKSFYSDAAGKNQAIVTCLV